ncbi:tRNA lysidine(34) synthetase TilS [Streptacidiphilus fuscans]|uniref:tRNA(Ile)-lysidine synthase n=1 Tax=Streptacidiphilus fuscans TaxID=2789292 RepID=A0A931BBD2_9ACTN|nr:tRNA lysidine(34) synthetase TilS [Streptacidiphilus fuscans]MBF9073558.1 tRNA lysidine(34) synthetase TilS [Streptacidiphilus fuscans]
MGPHPAVAAIRLAVRRVLAEFADDMPAVPATFAGAEHPDARPPVARPLINAVGDVDPRHAKYRKPRPRPADSAPLVLVACSGGADSMALAAATVFEAAKLGVRAGAVTVDHGLQSGSTTRALEVAARLRALGLDPVDALGVNVPASRGHGGPEAAARDARYAALAAAAERHGASAVLLGHTRDDQAETVLLGLARGSGTRSLSGMPAVTGRYRRPFLELERATTREACTVLDLPVWDDPHNIDPAYARARVRHEVLPVLEKHLGGGVVDALARTARLFRDDADALDVWAAQVETEVTHPDGLDAPRLAELPAAVRRRVLRRAALDAGAPGGELFARHVEAMDLLVTSWRGQGPVHLPGNVRMRRQSGRLTFRRA